GRPWPAALKLDEAEVERLVDAEELSQCLLAIRKHGGDPRARSQPGREARAGSLPLMSVGEDDALGIDDHAPANVLVLRLDKKVDSARRHLGVQVVQRLLQ